MPAVVLAFAGQLLGAAPAAAGEGPAVAIEAAYVGDILAIAAGGSRRTVRYLDNLEIGATLDLERLTRIDDMEVRLAGIYNNGTQFSPLVGDAQAVSNIEAAVRAARLYEAWIDKGLGPAASIRAGLYDLNSEFDALESADLFTNSAHGIGTDIAQGGRNGPSIFPVTGLAARLALYPAEGWTVRMVAIDGVPGDPQRPARTAIRLGGGDGALLVGEVEAPLPRGKLLFGHWRYTTPQDRIDGTGESRGSKGFYLRGEARLTSEGDGSENGLAAFFRIGFADGRFVPFSRFAAAGIAYSGPLPGRDFDRVGVAFALAGTGEDYRRQTGSRADELAVELTYYAPVTEWLALQPSIHYIANPQGEPGVTDALVLGLRVSIGAGFTRD